MFNKHENTYYVILINFQAAKFNITQNLMFFNSCLSIKKSQELKYKHSVYVFMNV